MASIGSLVVDLALESRNFINGMRQAQAQTTATSSAITSAMNLAKGAVGGFAGIMTVDFLQQQVMAAFDYADSLVDLADRTGTSTKFLQEFRYAAQMSGSSVEAADAAVDKFAKNLGAAQNGNKAMAATFSELGVTATDTDTAFRQTMDGIAKLGTVTQRNAKSVELFGKSAADMTALMSGGTAGFDDLAQAAQAYGIVIDDQVLRNAGQVNDKLDTMKMILNAQMANAIVQNADALVALANGFMTAATAAAHFFAQMDTKKLMSVANGINFNSDLPTVISGSLNGRSRGQIADDARAQLKTTAVGRQTLLTDIATRYNANLKKGVDPKSNHMMAMRAEGQQIRNIDAQSRAGGRPRPTTSRNLPVPPVTPRSAPRASTKSSGPSPEDLAKKEAQRVEQYNRELYSATDAELSARQALSNNIIHRSGFERELLDNATKREIDAINADVLTGKLKKEEADKLKELVAKTSESKLQLINNEETDRLISEVLAIKDGQLQNESDILSGQHALAKTQKARREISLRLVDLEYKKEKLALEAIGDSQTASDAEKQIAAARLRILGTLRDQSVEEAKRGTMGPMEEYLSNIPATADEINEALQKVQAEGLDGVQDDLLAVVRGTESVGEAFGGMVNGILDGLLKIALQQAIIKPLGSLLFGGGEGAGGGGIFGGIFKTIIGSVAGAATGGLTSSLGNMPVFDSVSAAGSSGLPSLAGFRANGGLTQPGDYMVGERGKEIVRIGQPANVIANHAIDRVSGANDNKSGVSISFGNITSNDPAAIKAAAFEAIAQAMPMIKQQASDHTIGKLSRPTLR